MKNLNENQIILFILLILTFSMLLISNIWDYPLGTDLHYYESEGIGFEPINAYHVAGILAFNLIGFNGFIVLIFFAIPYMMFQIVSEFKDEEIAMWFTILFVFGTLTLFYFQRQNLYSQALATLIGEVILWIYAKFIH